METATSMNIDIEAAGPCRKRVKVTIPPVRVTEEFDKSYKNLARSVPISGFRPGKAPRKLVEKRFGTQVVDEVRQALFDAALEEALSKNSLAPIADPELDMQTVAVEPDKEVAFDFLVTVKPEFELPDLVEIEVEVGGAEPTPEDLAAALDGLRKRKATLRPVEGGSAAEGDVVTLHVHGHVGGEEIFHEESLVYEIGSRYLGGLVAQGLDEALVGQKVGAKVKAKAFPLPSNESHPLAGSEADIDAEVLEIKRPELPPLDDAFAKGFDFGSLAEMREQVSHDVRARRARERDREVEDLALARLSESVSIELPQELIDREADEVARRAAYAMQLRKEPEEEIARKASGLKEKSLQRAAAELRSFFLLDKLVEKERILVTETEVKEAVAVLAAYNEKTPEQMYAVLRESGRLGTLRNQLKEQKARARLRAKVTVREAGAGQPAAPPSTTAASRPKEEKGKKQA
ncbi:MAG: trigger factor [Planctomycetaceae bacterium]